MIDFNILGNNNDLIKVTTAKKVQEDLNEVTERHAKGTASLKLKNFEYLMKGICENPAIYLPCLESLKIPEELYPICYKMAHFLRSEKYVIRHDIMSKNNINYVKYSYAVPLLLMPVLISFIASINSKIKASPTTIKDFFAKMDYYVKRYPLQKIVEEYTEWSEASLLTFVQDWIRIYLGRDYFSHLEELYNECATNENEKQILRGAVAPLTQLATFPTRRCHADILQLDKILQGYHFTLKQQAIAENRTDPDYSALYQTCEPYVWKSESEFIDKIAASFDSFYIDLKAQIEELFSTNHKAGSVYPLALQDIVNLETVKEKWDLLVEDMQCELGYSILDYYENYWTLLSKDIPFREVIVQDKYIKYKRQMLLDLFVGALSDTEDVLEKIYNDTKKSSVESPEKYSAKTTERLRSANISSEISRIQKETIAAVNRCNFSVTYPPYVRKNSFVCEKGFFFHSKDELLDYINTLVKEMARCNPRSELGD